ncbi:hypothetical protein KAT36_01200 [Candidatus Pacearchaeota archaeon]|nr:hypothetical protein [Candidatus Pacearchaeota archaeon]
MSKKLSLLERLDNALSITSSETEENQVYSLLYNIGKKAVEHNYETFYKKILNYQSLSLAENPVIRKNIQKITAGKELANKLKYTIILPERNLKHYGAKYRRATKKEYQLLTKFYQEEKNEKNI